MTNIEKLMQDDPDAPKYMRCILPDMNHVLRVELCLFDKVLFVDHSVWQPIQWYEKATAQEYQTFISQKNPNQ